jgi:hypothetical protein
MPAPWVLVGEPVRDRDPRRPASGDGPGPVQGPPDPEQALILPHGTVHHQDHEILDAIAGQTGHGDPAALILPGEPVGNTDELVRHQTTTPSHPATWSVPYHPKVDNTEHRFQPASSRRQANHLPVS